jgi:ATP-dependent Clp protease ATP-binding subunit ClpC
MAGEHGRLTERARKALERAEEEAKQLNHNYVGTEHLLLGLARDEESVAAKLLAHHGATLETLRAIIGQQVGRGSHPPTGDLRITPRARRAIELAIDEAQQWRLPFVGTEHLLLGILRERDGIGANILAEFGMRYESFR